MNQKSDFCLAIEKFPGVIGPRRGQLIRVLFLEFSRILSNLLNITTQAMDVGALTPPPRGFKEREKLMVFYERVLGSELRANYFRPGGVHQNMPAQLIDDIKATIVEAATATLSVRKLVAVGAAAVVMGDPKPFSQ